MKGSEAPGGGSEPSSEGEERVPADAPIGEHPVDPPTAGALTVPEDFVPRRRQGVLDIDMGDGFIVYDDASSLVHHLNPSATLIWQLCDGTGTVRDLARDIAEEYGLDEPTIRSQVAEVIAEFDALELVEDARNLFSERGR